VHGKVI